jgi:hypothetical protein
VDFCSSHKQADTAQPLTINTTLTKTTEQHDTLLTASFKMTDKIFTTKKTFQYYLPLALTLFMTVTIERTVFTDGGYDRLYGLPLPYISSALGYSFNYQVYILAMTFNLLFYFGLTVLLLTGLTKLGLRLKTHWAFIILGILVTFFWITSFYVLTMDSNFHFLNDRDYKTLTKKVTLKL